MNLIAIIRVIFGTSLLLRAVLLLTFDPIAAGQAPGSGKANETGSAIKSETLAHDFFAAIREGDTKKFLSYVPEQGINSGRQPQHLTRSEVEEDLLHHRGLYCRLFDSSCINAQIKLDASARACSDRELLTQSEKIRTAATETTRNGVRQAIVVAEVKNDACGGARLIDFIFNLEHGEWKLFSAP